MSRRLYCDGCGQVVTSFAVEADCTGTMRHRRYGITSGQKLLCAAPVRETTRRDEAVLKQCEWWDQFAPMQSARGAR